MRRTFALAAVLLLMLSVLAGCSSNYNKSEALGEGASMTETAAVYQEEPDNYAAAASEGNLDLVAGTGETHESQIADSDRKLIKTIWLTAETEDFDALLEGVTQQIANAGGYIQNKEAYHGSSYNTNRQRYAELTIRIPTAQLTEFVSQVSGIANITSSRETADDVTLTYADTQSRLKALEVERDRLLELLEKAETTQDLLEIESRLTDVRYELENAASQLKLYDNLISYSTVYLTLQEVQKLTPVEELSTWEKITTGFAENLQRLGNGLLDLMIAFLTSLPFLVPLGAVILVIVLLIRRSGKKRNKKERPQEEEKP